MYIKGLGKSVLAFCLFTSNFFPPRICDYLEKYTQKQNDKIIEGVKPKGKYK